MGSTARNPDLRRLDIALAARHGRRFDGCSPLADFERLREEGQAPLPGDVTWSAQAAERARPGTAPQVRLRLEAAARVERTCQRCLQPVQLALQVQRDFLFVADEDQAAELDADNDQEDVLELTRHLDLQALIEDELLLAMPLVPRHEACPQPLLAPASRLEDEAQAPHPFAALARLRGPRDG